MAQKPTHNPQLWSSVYRGKKPVKQELTPDEIVIADGVVSTYAILNNATEMLCLRYSPDGEFICTGDSNGHIKVHQVATKKIISHLKMDVADTLSDNLIDSDMLQTTCLRFYPQAEGKLLLSSYSNGHLVIWDLESKTIRLNKDEKRTEKQTLCMGINPEGTMVVTGGTDPTVNLYDAESLTSIRALNHSKKNDQMDGHVSRVFSAAFNPVDTNIIVTSGWDSTIQFWDVRQNVSFKRIFGTHVCGDSIDFHPSGQLILSGSYRAEAPIQLWNFNTCELVTSFGVTPYDGTSQIYAAQYLGADLIAVGGTLANRVKIYDANNYESVGSLTMLRNAVFSMDNDHVSTKPYRLAASSGQAIYILNVKKPKPLYTYTS